MEADMIKERKSLISLYMSDLRKVFPFPDRKPDASVVISWIEDYEQGGDLDKRDMVICSAAYMVVAKATFLRDKFNLSEYYLDMIQEGNLALFEALDKFEERFNCSFATYARYHVNSRLFRYALRRLEERRCLADSTDSDLDLPQSNIKELLFADHEATLEIIQGVEQDEVRAKTIQFLKQYFSEQELEIFLLRSGLITGKVCTNNEVVEILGLPKTRVQQVVQKITTYPRFKWFFAKLLNDTDSVPEPLETLPKLKPKLTLERLQVVYKVLAAEFNLEVCDVIAAFQSPVFTGNVLAWAVAWLLYHCFNSSTKEISQLVGIKVRALGNRRLGCRDLMATDSDFNEKMLRLSKLVANFEMKK